MFEKKIDNKKNNNNNNNKVVNNDSSLKKFSKDNDIQFILFRLQIILANNWFLDSFSYIHKTKILDACTTPFFCNHVQSGSHHHINKKEKELKTKNSRYIIYKKRSC